MSKKIDVVVAKGNKFIRWARERPVRHFPGGIVGVVYNSLARPVYEHRFDSLSIDIDDEGLDSAECPIWQSSDPLLYKDDKHLENQSKDINWYIETNSNGHYLVFDGDESTLDRILVMLIENEIGVIRHAKSHRPADNGIKYDWFIRLRYGGTREEAYDLITNLFLNSLSENVDADAQHLAGTEVLINFLPKRIRKEALLDGMQEFDIERFMSWLGDLFIETEDDLEERIFELQAKLDKANEQTSGFQIELEGTKRTASLDKSKYETTIAGLHSEIDELRNKFDLSVESKDTISVLKAKIAKLETEISNNTDYIDGIEKEWVQRDEEVVSLKSELEDTREFNLKLTKQADKLTKKIEALKETKLTVSAKTERIVRASLQTFHNIDIDDAAVDTISDWFLDPLPLFKILKSLNNKESLPSKNISTAGGWFEIQEHIGTGQSKMGRVYFKKQKSGRLAVVIHHKKDNKEQNRYFKNTLGNPNFPQFFV